MTDTAPDSLGADLYEHICCVYAAATDYDRERAHWVMNPEWFSECLKVAPGSAAPPEVPKTLFGLPIEVREDGGAPHLVAD